LSLASLCGVQAREQLEKSLPAEPDDPNSSGLNPNEQERPGVDKLPRFCLFINFFIPFFLFFPLFYLIPAFLLFILFTVLPFHLYFNGGREWQRNP
jgi:hypothetical protein